MRRPLLVKPCYPGLCRSGTDGVCDLFRVSDQCRCRRPGERLVLVREDDGKGPSVPRQQRSATQTALQSPHNTRTVCKGARLQTC